MTLLPPLQPLRMKTIIKTLFSPPSCMSFCPSGPNFLNASIPKDFVIHSVLYSTSFLRHFSLYHHISPHLLAVTPSSKSLVFTIFNFLWESFTSVHRTQPAIPPKTYHGKYHILAHSGQISVPLHMSPCTLESGKIKRTFKTPVQHESLT